MLCYLYLNESDEFLQKKYTAILIDILYIPTFYDKCSVQV